VSKKHNPHIGSSLDDWLAEEGLLEESEEKALEELRKSENANTNYLRSEKPTNPCTRIKSNQK
jgi:hypothetical protein